MKFENRHKDAFGSSSVKTALLHFPKKIFSLENSY